MIPLDRMLRGATSGSPVGKPTPAVLALDTEDDTRGTVTLINLYDGQRHVTFSVKRSSLPGVIVARDIRPRAWAYIESLAPALVWACNLEYDLVNTYGDWVAKLVTLQ